MCPFFRRCSLALVLCAPLAHAGRGIDRIDFKYGSEHHLAPEMRFATLRAPFEKVVERITAALKQDGAVLVDRLPGEVISVPADGRACWDAAMAIIRAEWRAFTLNSFKDYKKIERKAACPEVMSAPVPEGRFGLVLKFELPAWQADGVVTRRVADRVTWDGSGFVDGTASPAEAVADIVGGLGVSSTLVAEQVETQFTTRLIFAVWGAEDGTTRVYSRGYPVNAGVESAPGNSIGRVWLSEVKGEREARLVRAYLEWLEGG